MPECRRCGVALAPDELDVCAACWDHMEARESSEDPYLELDRG